MRIRSYTLASMVALMAGPGSMAAGQVPGPYSVEVSVGRGSGSTDGTYRSNDTGLTVDVLFAARVYSFDSGGVVAALSTGIQGSGPLAACLPASNGGCVPPFPSFAVWSATIGWETSGGGLRGLIGPAVVSDETTVMGALGHVDAAAAVGSRVWLVVSARGIVIPSYQRDRFRLGSLGVGFRIR